jgi:hypothetical protein
MMVVARQPEQQVLLLRSYDQWINTMMIIMLMASMMMVVG